MRARPTGACGAANPMLMESARRSNAYSNDRGDPASRRPRVPRQRTEQTTDKREEMTWLRTARFRKPVGALHRGFAVLSVLCSMARAPGVAAFMDRDVEIIGGPPAPSKLSRVSIDREPCPVAFMQLQQSLLDLGARAGPSSVSMSGLRSPPPEPTCLARKCVEEDARGPEPGMRQLMRQNSMSLSSLTTEDELSGYEPLDRCRSSICVAQLDKAVRKPRAPEDTGPDNEPCSDGDAALAPRAD